MSTAQGAVAPYQGQAVAGEIVQPPNSALINPRSVATKRFLHVVSELVRRSGAYHSETDQLDALRAIETFGKHVIDAADHHRVKAETDVAPMEDVSLRKAPGGAPPAPVPGLAIDYNQLAAAILAAQRQAAQPAQSITDAAPSRTQDETSGVADTGGFFG